MTDIKEIVKILQQKKYKIRSQSGNKIIVEVNLDRFQAIKDLVSVLKSFDAKYDKNVSGSSIGGIKIDKVVILVKSIAKGASLDVEAAAIRTLQEAITQAMIVNGGPITIKVKNKRHNNCIGVQKTPGTPKSDFAIINSNKKPVIYISHKKGSRPNDFQQWSGMTEDDILNHPEVQDFISECKSLFGNKMPPGVSVYKKINSKELKTMSVFGVDYLTHRSGINNVDVLIQGDPGLKKVGEHWELTTTGNIHYNGDLPEQGFDPVLTLIYKGDRNQFDIKGARASIYPIQGRKMVLIEEYAKRR